MSVSKLLDDLDSPHAETRQAAHSKLAAFLESPLGNETVGSLAISLAGSVWSERTAQSLSKLAARMIAVRDLAALLETSATEGWTHTVARMTVRRWFEDAGFTEAAEGASVCVLWAAQSGDERLGEFVCDVILKRAASRPHASLRAVLPVLQSVARRRRLKRLQGFLGPIRASQQDKPYGEAFVALDRLLPLRDLPIPSGTSPDADGLPIPSRDAEIAPDDLPSPATEAKSRVRR